MVLVLSSSWLKIVLSHTAVGLESTGSYLVKPQRLAINMCFIFGVREELREIRICSPELVF